MPNITLITDKGLCNACGACVAICPSKAINIEYNWSRGFQMKVNNDKCVHCELCLKVCPIINSTCRLSENMNFEENVGYHLCMYVGYSLDTTLKLYASSGGVVREIIRYLLEKKKADVAVIVLRTKCPLFPLPSLITYSDPKDLAKLIASSKYCLCPLGLSFKTVERAIANRKRVVVVGLPCHLRALYNFLKAKSQLDVNNCIFLIGLICSHNNYLASTLNMLSKYDVDLSKIKDIDYRGGIWPGYVIVTLRNNKRKLLGDFPSLWIKYLSNPLFIPLSCHICLEPISEVADIVVGDAWFPELLNNVEHGFSLIIIRTQKGLSLISNIIENKKIYAKKINPRDVIRSQDFRSKRIIAYFTRVILYKFYINRKSKLRKALLHIPSYYTLIGKDLSIVNKLKILQQLFLNIIAALVFHRKASLITRIMLKMPNPIYNFIHMIYIKICQYIF